MENEAIAIAGLGGLLAAGFALLKRRKNTAVSSVGYRIRPPRRDSATIQAAFNGVGGTTTTPAPRRPTTPQPPRPPAGGSGLGPLLNVIGRAEAPRGYDQIWGGINLADYPPKPLTQMTIGQVLDWQDSIDSRYNSEASGRYQFIEDTLRRIYRKAGLTRNDLFNAANQDRLAIVLINEKGLSRYRAGRMTPKQFGDKLARVWAGLPVHSTQRGHKRTVQRGQSYYAGDSLNRATISPEAVEAAIRRI